MPPLKLKRLKLKEGDKVINSQKQFPYNLNFYGQECFLGKEAVVKEVFQGGSVKVYYPCEDITRIEHSKDFELA